MGTSTPKPDPSYTVDELKKLGVSKKENGINFFENKENWKTSIEQIGGYKLEIHTLKENRRMSEKNMGKEVKEMAKKLIVERSLSGGRMGINDDLTNTNLISKNYSPLFIRKLNCIFGWPLYVSMICDEDVSEIDKIINSVVQACKEEGMLGNNLQDMRNFTGILSETLINYYNGKKENCVEGIGILLAVDKAMISNLYGDYMNHAMCRSEFYSILNMMPHI